MFPCVACATSVLTVCLDCPILSTQSKTEGSVLNSKEVLEQTGISRATLNNYISTGLIPRPEVLPPNPEDGAAPRIGYFPDDTVERITQIQRLKREGWTTSRIAAPFAAGAHPEPTSPPPPGPAPRQPAAVPGAAPSV